MYMYVYESERLRREQWGGSHTQGSEELGLGSLMGVYFNQGHCEGSKRAERMNG